MKPLNILLITLLFTLSVFAQDKKSNSKPVLPPSFPKGTVVIPKFNGGVLNLQKVSTWSGRSSYSGILWREDDGSYTIGSFRDWKEKGWSVMQEFVVEKISRENKEIILECRSPIENIKLFIGPTVTNLDEALHEVFFKGSLNDYKNSDYYKKEVLARYLPQIFNGKLSNISDDIKINLIEAVKFNGNAIRGEEFKDNFYLSLNAGKESVFYNTNMINQAERTARVVEKTINAGLKQATVYGQFPEIKGLKITLEVGYADFIREGEYPAHYDEIQMYFLLDVIKQFNDADITNQQLVDKSIILVNGNRVQVSLTQFN